LWLPPAHALLTFFLCFLGSVLALRRALKIEPASAFR
jgi:ABC-type lipoprotein release transport system permease subunit